MMSILHISRCLFFLFQCTLWKPWWKFWDWVQSCILPLDGTCRFGRISVHIFRYPVRQWTFTFSSFPSEAGHFSSFRFDFLVTFIAVLGIFLELLNSDIYYVIILRPLRLLRWVLGLCVFSCFTPTTTRPFSFERTCHNGLVKWDVSSLSDYSKPGRDFETSLGPCSCCCRECSGERPLLIADFGKGAK